MPVTLTSPVLLALTALIAGMVLLLIGVLLGWREVVRQSATMRQELIAQMSPEFTAHTRQIETLLSAHHALRQSEDEAVRQDLSAIRADLEWLAGERMIEQALTMFREGVSVKDVSQELGLPVETVRTLNLLRAH
jgi:pilus assembly protein TadC